MTVLRGDRRGSLFLIFLSKAAPQIVRCARTPCVLTSNIIRTKISLRLILYNIQHEALNTLFLNLLQNEEHQTVVSTNKQVVCDVKKASCPSHVANRVGYVPVL